MPFSHLPALLTATYYAGGEHVRALLDDSISGGTTLAGNTSAPVGIPTVTWGTPEGQTPIPLFDTTNLIGQLQATVFPVGVGVEVGRDLMADSPQAVGDTLEQAIGERVQQELDRVIVSGDGVSQPTGILVSAGDGPLEFPGRPGQVLTSRRPGSAPRPGGCPGWRTRSTTR
jgi:HK97 family phage major capsid protein